jgi:hypothetical protein
MTEAEWLECTDLFPMLLFLQGKASDRKLRLFGCACCHRISALDCDPQIQKALEVAERFADGKATIEERERANHSARIAVEDERIPSQHRRPRFQRNTINFYARQAVCWLLSGYLASWQASTEATKAMRAANNGDSSATEDVVSRERLVQANLLRDIFGNPFRPITIATRWLTPSVVALAQAIYNERAFDRMPTLADALMGAGCGNEEVLAHCRSEATHVRGCWVVDLLLGKE